MIALVDREEDRQRVLRLCEKTAFGCKIASVISSYGFDKGFACFWLDTGSDVVFCHADDLMVISGTVLNVDEAREFLRAVGPRTVMCAVRNAEALSLGAAESGDVLKKQLNKGEGKTPDPYSVNIREVYGLLKDNDMVDEFEPFYLDFSHKLRHNAALAFTEYRGEELAGCAVISSMSKSAALLSAVVVRPEFRRQGIGSELIRRAEEAFPGKTMYVFREKEKHREFYKKLGYSKADTWVYSQL